MQLEYINCNLCNSDDPRPLFKTKDYALGRLDTEFCVVQCRRCGLCYLNPRPAQAELPKIYPYEYFAYGFDVKEMNRVNKFKYSFIKRRFPGTLLDVGCKKGEFMAFMKKKKWGVYGIEISEKPEDAYGLGTIARSTLEDAYFKPKSFDVITAWAVLEHMYNPLSFLKKAHEVLKDDGEILILAPNILSLPARILKGDDVPRHLYFFSKGSICRMLDDAGFCIEKYFFDDHISKLSHKGLLMYFLTKILRKNMDNFFLDKYNLGIANEKKAETCYDKLRRMGLFGITFKALDYFIDSVVDKVSILFNCYGTMIVRAVKKC